MRTRITSLLAPSGLLRVLAAVVVISLLVPAISAPAAPAALPRAANVALSTLPASTCNLVGTVRTCELWAREGSITLPTGELVTVWGFADAVDGTAQMPGPVLIANAGETLQIWLHNDLPGETISLAFPGHSSLVPDLDGVATGTSIMYEFTVNEPGTFLYEAGLTPNGGRQVAMGLFGGLIVRPAAPGQAYDDITTAYNDEALLVLSEIDPAFNADPYNFPMHEYAPRYWLINGQAYSQTATIDTYPGNTVLLRYVNAGLKTHWMGTLGVQQRIIGSDGKPRALPRQVVAETVASGQTVDVLIPIPASAAPGSRYTLYDTNMLLHNANLRYTAGGPLAFGGMMTFISVAGTPPPDNTGPTATVSVDPSNTTGATGVTLTVVLDDTPNGGQNVVAAEYFIDTIGDPGTGSPLTVGTPAPAVTLIEFIDPIILDGLASGQHVFYARGQDELGDWGALGSAVLNLDKTGPSVTGLSLSPDPSNGQVSVLLRATGDDRDTGGNNVIDGRYCIDCLTPTWLPMTLSRTDASVTAMTADLAQATLDAMAEGLYPIEVSAQDSLFTWGASSVVTLTLDKTGPEAPVVTLAPNLLDFSQPASLPTHVRLTAVMTDALSNGVQSVLANAEAFIGPAGLEGTGFALFPSDGLFDEASEAVYFDIPVVNFSQLAEGLHPVTVRGLDAAGNWGAVGSADITIVQGGGGADVTGPVITAIDASPNPTNGATQVTLQAVASDVDLQSNVAAGEWFVGADPGVGLGTPLDPWDGAFDSPSELMTAVIALNETDWPKGRYTISVRAQDSAGNWGEVSTVQLRVKW